MIAVILLKIVEWLLYFYRRYNWKSIGKTSGINRIVSVSDVLQGGSMPNTSSSVPFLLSSSMQSIRSRRPSAVLGGSQGSGLLQQLGSGMVRLTSSHQPINGRTFSSSSVRKCPSLNITFSWMYVRMTVSSRFTLTLLLLPHKSYVFVVHLIHFGGGYCYYFLF